MNKIKQAEEKQLNLPRGSPLGYWNQHLVHAIRNASFQACLIENHLELLMLNEKHRGEYRWKFMDMKIFSFHKALIFPRFHHLYSTFNAKMSYLTTGGFFELWLKRWKKSRYNVEKPPEPDPTVLSLTELGIGFQIWLIMVSISSAAFITEFLIYYGPKLWNLVLFRIILKSYYKSLRAVH